MSTLPDQRITRLLGSIREVDEEAWERLAELVYDRLRARARGQLRSPLPGNILMPTALVHDAYLKLVNQREAQHEVKTPRRVRLILRELTPLPTEERPMSVDQLVEAPKCESYRLISFEKAYLAKTSPPTLVVEGQAPCVNMEVSLQARIYIRCPEYWGIEVVGCLPGGFCLNQTQPYKKTLLLAGMVGSRGVEVVGANQSEKFELAGGCSDETHCDVAVN